MSWFFNSKNPLAIILRTLSLPAAAPLIAAGVLMTDAMNTVPDANNESFRTAVWQYLKGVT